MQKVEENTLKAYGPQTQEYITLFEDVKGAKELFKKACIVTITCETIERSFDLSLMIEV